MIVAARRRLSRVLARAAARINPDPPTTVTSVQQNYAMQKALADIIEGYVVGYGVARRGFKPGTGTDYSY